LAPGYHPFRIAASSSLSATELFIRLHNETPSVAAMRVSNPDVCPRESTAARNQNSDQPYSDCPRYFPYFTETGRGLLIIQNALRRSFAHLKLCAHFLDLRLLFFQCLINEFQEYRQWKHQQHKDGER